RRGPRTARDPWLAGREARGPRAVPLRPLRDWPPPRLPREPGNCAVWPGERGVELQGRDGWAPCRRRGGRSRRGSSRCASKTSSELVLPPSNRCENLDRILERLARMLAGGPADSRGLTSQKWIDF